MPPIWVGFWAQHSLNKSPFFGRFSLNVGRGLVIQKLAKNSQKWVVSLPKFIIKVSTVETRIEEPRFFFGSLNRFLIKWLGS